MTTPDAGDLAEISGSLKLLVREAEGINKRLDKVNGRIDRHEDALAAAVMAVAELKIKVATLNHEVFDRGGAERTEANQTAILKDLQELIRATTAGDNRPAFTVGDVNVVTKVGKLVWALIGLFGGMGLLYWAQQVAK